MPASIEIMLHAFLTVYYIGWASGFFYYTLAIIPLVFGSPTISKWSKFYLTLLIAFFYISLKYYSNLHLPVVALNPDILHYLYYMNSFFMIISISALVYYSSLGSQITENKIGNERTKADLANRAKSAFLANISHELRTPLNAIIGYSEMIKDEEEELGHSRNVDDLKKISNAGNHLLSLINNILDLSKIESGKTELEYQVVNINSLIDEVIATITPL
ncbi:MAG: hypothetical protein OEW97_08745, partial [Gammaproteobacteria bacterium]|nr:hypothetical protein [Gammaproteobacteria bacterium]